MAITKLVSSSSQAYQNILNRLVDDVGPVWDLVNQQEYSPFWLLIRSMMPIAESIGDLIHQNGSTSMNLEALIENELTAVRPIYSGKGTLIATLYRHSLMHQDEPRSIFCGNITIHWNVAFIDGRYHLKTSNKDVRRRSCVMQFDLRTFYEDLQSVLRNCISDGPRKGVVKRYNSWTFLNINTMNATITRKVTLKDQVRNFYTQI